MKKLTAFLLAAVLMLALCACGETPDDGAADGTTTAATTTTTTTSADGTTTAGAPATDGTTAATAAPTTTAGGTTIGYVPSGATVPIGTKPTTTTTTRAPSTTTTAAQEDPGDGTVTTTTTATKAPTTTTTTTVKPTEPTGPYIVLPEIGSDIDVTKKKNRIRVSAASASFNEDGTIHVALTFKNYTSNWITEETDYVKYGYYKGSTRKGTATLYIGVIDTKKHPVKTFEFDVPAYTTEVRITSSKITYWTEWA